jgi:nickel-dependent lactate racemase
MRVDIPHELEHVDLKVPDAKLVRVKRQPVTAGLRDPADAVRLALDSPWHYPALRRALTPDDRVVVVVDDRLPHVESLVTPILEHVTSAHVAPSAMTVLMLDAGARDWTSRLTSDYRDVAIEVHDPQDRRRLAYLATTRKGRRIYLNRTAVEADQVVILSRDRYDPLLGYWGPAGELYPGLSDEATRRELSVRLSNAAPGATLWPTSQESEEVAWLLGAPFMVHVINGSGDEIAHVVAGDAATATEARRLLDARWRISVEQPADTVVAIVGGDPVRQDFSDLASALACAARVVSSGGKIILLSRGQPTLGRGAEILCQADTPEVGLALLRRESPADAGAALQWATAVEKASVYLLSNLSEETTEDLFATPLEHVGQVQRLLGADGSCLFIEDAHKTMAVLAE